MCEPFVCSLVHSSSSKPSVFMSPSSSRQHSKEITMRPKKCIFVQDDLLNVSRGQGSLIWDQVPKLSGFFCFLLYCPPLTWYCLHTPHPYPCPSLLLTWKPKEVDQQLRQSKSLPSYQHTRTSIMLMMKILPKIPEIMLCLISKIFQLFRKKTFDLDMNWRHCIYLFGGIIIFSSKGIQQSICIEFDWSQQFKFWHIILLFMSHQIDRKLLGGGNSIIMLKDSLLMVAKLWTPLKQIDNKSHNLFDKNAEKSAEDCFVKH